MLYTKDLELTATGEQTLLSVPPGYNAVVKYVFIANHGGSNNSVSMYVDKHNSSNTFYVAEVKNLHSKEIFELPHALFVLQPEDTIKVNIGSSGDVGFAVTFDLIDKPPVFRNFNGGN